MLAGMIAAYRMRQLAGDIEHIIDTGLLAPFGVLFGARFANYRFELRWWSSADLDRKDPFVIAGVVRNAPCLAAIGIAANLRLRRHFQDFTRYRGSELCQRLQLSLERVAGPRA